MHVLRTRWSVAVALAAVLAGAKTGAQAPSQPRVRLIVRAEERPVFDAIIRAGVASVRTDSSGTAELVLAVGPLVIRARKLGLRPDSVVLLVRQGMDTTVTIVLAPLPNSLADIVVTSTRTEERIEDVPIRVEVLAGEDIDEKSSMRPGDLTQMVAEIPGVRVQPLSSGAGGASLRVQGFRSQYTQFLVDGLPVTGESDGGLSLVQVPPLDLAQVEVVKAGASALYGPSALGGVLNFVSRHPPKAGEPAIREFLFSGSSYRAADGVTFIAAPLTSEWGSTVIVTGHVTPAVDRDGDGWRDIPQSKRISVRPRFFWSNGRGSHAMVTASAAADERVNGLTGGHLSPSGTPFADSLSTRRSDAGGVVHLILPRGALFDAHFATQVLARDRRQNSVIDRERSGSSYFDASGTLIRGAISWMTGAAIKIETNRSIDISGFDYRFGTTSLFSQLNGPLVKGLSYSATGRCDHHSRYGTRCVPLLAILARPSEAVTIRFSGALGSHAPTPFTEETAVTGLSHFRPFTGPASNALRFEMARQGSVDAGYHRGGLDLDASLYSADILHSVGIRDLANGPFAQELAVSSGPTRIRGADLFAVYTGDPVSLTAFYGALRTSEINLDAGPSAPLRREIPLSPSRRAGLDVAFDIEEIGTRVAVEGYYTGIQMIADDPYRRRSKPFTTIEALATQTVGRAQLFLSAENLTNVRQTSFDPLLLPAPSASGRWTTDVWAPLSGRILRLGARVNYSAR